MDNIDWLAKIHRDILKTQEMILDFHKQWAEFKKYELYKKREDIKKQLENINPLKGN